MTRTTTTTMTSVSQLWNQIETCGFREDINDVKGNDEEDSNEVEDNNKDDNNDKGM